MKLKSYLKFTGDTVIVLFASNIMAPLTVGSFLLILQKKKSSNKLNEDSQCIVTT